MEMENSIYEELRKENCDVVALAEEWRNSYGANAAECRVSFYRLIFNCANIEFSNTDCRDSLSHIDSAQDVEDGAADSGILSRNILQSRLEEFIRLCFVNKSDEILFDERFWDNVTIIINKMIKSKYKLHRWTAVIFDFTIVDALATILYEEHNSVSEDSVSDESDEWRPILKATFSAMIEAGFHVAFRDIEFDIQKKCLLHLQHWLSKYPDEFMTTRYFRYVTWGCTKRTPSLRLLSLKISKIVLEYPNSGMVNVFAQRLVLNTPWNSSIPDEICLGIECLRVMKRNYPLVADQINRERLYKNVFYRNQKIASTTAELILLDIRDSNSVDSLALSLVRVAEKTLKSCPLPPGESFNLSYETNERLLVFVDAFFDLTKEIYNIRELARILELEAEKTSFKQFTSVFLKAVARRAFLNKPVPFRNVGGEAQELEISIDMELPIEVTDRLLSCLGQLILAFNENKIILKNLLGICEFLYCDEDSPFDYAGLENLTMAVVDTFKRASEHDELESCVMAFHHLNERCVAKTNQNFFKAKMNVVIDNFVSDFQELYENWEARISQEGSISYFEELTSLMKKLSHFKIPLTTFEGCEFFVRYAHDTHKSGVDMNAEMTVWFEVVELSLEIMCNHAETILDVKGDVELEPDEEHCLNVCLDYFPRYMCFRSTSKPGLYFVNSFCGCIRIIRMLHEAELFEKLVDDECKKYISRCFLHFIKKHMVPFQADASTKQMERLWAEFSEFLLTAPINFEILPGLLEIFTNVAENIFFQRGLLTTLASLFNQKPECCLEVLMSFLITSFQRSATSNPPNKLKATFSVLAEKIDKDKLQSDFFRFHIRGVELYTSKKIDSEFLLFLKATICFLSARGLLALKTYLNRNLDGFQLANKHFKSYKHVVDASVVHSSGTPAH